MAQADIQAILREFEPIRRAIAQPEGTDAIEIASMPNAAYDDRWRTLVFLRLRQPDACRRSRISGYAKLYMDY